MQKSLLLVVDNCCKAFHFTCLHGFLATALSHTIVETGVRDPLPPPSPFLKMITPFLELTPDTGKLAKSPLFQQPLQKDIINIAPPRIHPSPPLSLAILPYIPKIIVMIDVHVYIVIITIIVYY